MRDVLMILVKAIGAGSLVVISALIGESLQPKRFAGLFSAAPSVAIASLAIGAAFLGTAHSKSSAETMVVGGAAMVVAILVGVPVIKRLQALRATVVVSVIWLVIAVGWYVSFVR
jgi:hypothetical protein